MQLYFLGILILIVVSLGVTLFVTKYSYLNRLSEDKRENLLPILFLASFTIYGLFFSLVSLFKADPENIDTIGYDIFQIDIGFSLIILGCGLSIYFAATQYKFKQDTTSKMLIALSGLIVLIGFLLILTTGTVYQKLS
jgi:hypothetical protein